MLSKRRRREKREKRKRQKSVDWSRTGEVLTVLGIGALAIATVADIAAMTDEERAEWLASTQGDKTCNRCGDDEFRIDSHGMIECMGCELKVGEADTWAV